MSRFADADAEHAVDLPGDCQCPGAPHAADTVWVKGDFSSREIADIQRVTAKASEGPDDNATLAPVLLPYVRRWNLLDRNGAEVPVTVATLELLRPPDFGALIEGIAEVVSRSSAVPNRSGGPSAESPLGTASPTP